MQTTRRLLVGLLFTVGCASPIAIDVQLVDPCNQDAIQAVDFLKFEPRGTMVDSAGLTTIQRVADNGATPIPVPLAEDFRLVVTGHRMTFDAPPAGIGVSGQHDLASVDQSLSLRIPFALIDQFYRTTDLADSSVCTEMSNARYGATTTYLPASNKVLIVGGITDGGMAPRYRRAVEIFDPATGQFKVVAELRAGGARAFHTATLLGDGRVLVAGGQAEVGSATESLRSALIIDASDIDRVSVSNVITLRQARTGHVAVRLTDGRVVLAGGRLLTPGAGRPEDHTYLSSVEIYDDTRNSFIVPDDGTGASVVELSQPRYGHSGTLLGSGNDILIAGGFNKTGPERSLEVIRVRNESIEVVTTSTRTRTDVGAIFHGAALAEDGRVLLSGGYGQTLDADPEDRGVPMNPSANVEMWSFDAGTGVLRRSCSAAMSGARGHHTVSMIGRRALFVGGYTADGAATQNAEIVTLADTASCFAHVPNSVQLDQARARHSATLLGSGEILILGGLQQGGASERVSLPSAEIFSAARSP